RLADQEVEPLLLQLALLNAEDKFIQSRATFANDKLSVLFEGVQSNWDAVEEHLRWMESFTDALTSTCGQSNLEQFSAVRTELANLIA
ncbi:hypothetical protein ABTA61_19640, partial [Acinetobacter baumannii]